jgi:hypothetical protein
LPTTGASPSLQRGPNNAASAEVGAMR